MLSHGLEVGLLKRILELFLISPLSNKFGTCIPAYRTVESIFIMSLSVLAVIRDPLLHKKLASAGNLETGFPLHYSVPLLKGLKMLTCSYNAGLEPPENIY